MSLWATNQYIGDIAGSYLISLFNEVLGFTWYASYSLNAITLMRIAALIFAFTANRSIA
jgi:hypothetical protein